MFEYLPVVYRVHDVWFVPQFEEGELKSIINAQKGDGTSEQPAESEVNHTNCLDRLICPSLVSK